MLVVRVATGAKNQRHESRTDENVYLYCARVQCKNKLTFSNYTFSNYTFSNVKTETKQMHS